MRAVSPKAPVVGEPQALHDKAIHPLSVALAQVSEAVIAVDCAGHVSYLNPTAETLTGCAAASAVGRPLATVLNLYELDGAGPIQIHGARTLVNEGGDIRHAVLAAENNQRAVVEYRITAIRADGGGHAGAVVTLRDISRRHAAEHALFEEKERAHVTLNSIGDAVISTDFRGRVSFLNAVAEKMTGRTQTEASGRKVDEVFLLVEASSRQAMRCPTMTAIIEDRRVDIDPGCCLIQKDGTEIAVEGSAAPIHDRSGGVSGAVMVARDVTEARDMSQRLARLALHDNLTELPNRALFTDRLDQALVRAVRQGNSVAVLFIDLDRFKPVNDALGHAVGDQLLQAVAQRLKACIRNSDTACRYGGDEFLILLSDVEAVRDAVTCAEKIRQMFVAPHDLNGQTVQVSASIGIALFPEDASDAATLLKHADAAMYAAKCDGRNAYRCFEPRMLAAAASS